MFLVIYRSRLVGLDNAHIMATSLVARHGPSESPNRSICIGGTCQHFTCLRIIVRSLKTSAKNISQLSAVYYYSDWIIQEKMASLTWEHGSFRSVLAMFRGQVKRFCCHRPVQHCRLCNLDLHRLGQITPYAPRQLAN
jgi:hypothetical protein